MSYEKLESVTFKVDEVSYIAPPLPKAEFLLKTELMIVEVEVRESLAMNMAPPLFEAKLLWKLQSLISTVEPDSIYIAPPSVALAFVNVIFTRITWELFVILNIADLSEPLNVYPLPSRVMLLEMLIPPVPTVALSASEKV